ncbi:MAG: MBL fold metallo-hydrolase [Lachnospiraceae bacterium]|nr:MBL fold metallo-hydrolase [Lachnospiraceae bacterium]
MEGQEIDRMKRQAGRLVAMCILPVILLCSSCTYKMNPAAGKTLADQVQEEQGASGRMEVHFMDVGQGDAALIICDGHAMLFDTGENDTGVFLQFYLMKQGIDHLDYVIGSHPEADHIGGMDVVLLKYDCDNVMLPNISVDTATYKDVCDAMTYKGYQSTVPRVGEMYPLGEASFTIIAPNRDDYGEEINNYSVGIKLVHGENTFLFTGDAELLAEIDMLENGISLDADVLKAGHHGSSDASSAKFVEAVSPEYAVISCGKENNYGHPHKETLAVLEAAGAEIYRTDEQGSIIAISDGKDLVWEANEEVVWQGVYYVGNKNNRKLHRSTCSFLPKEWNQVIFESKEEAAHAGFTDACGGCKP